METENNDNSPLTLAQVYTKVRQHLLTQGKKSISANRDVFSGGRLCLYRGPEGTKCAVGCLIEDEFYSPEWEGLQAAAPPVVEALRKSGVHVDSRMEGLLLSLQSIHDGYNPEQWAENLDRIANVFRIAAE